MEFNGTLLTIIAMLVSFNTLITPNVVVLVTKSHWQGSTKAAVAAGSCIATAVIAVLVAGTQSALDVAVALPIALYAMHESYEKYWKATGLAPWIGQLTDRKTFGV